MTDIELQKTNTTLRRLSDEMRSYSIERSKEREEELRVEVDRIHSEIKLLQRTNEDSATISDKLSREVSGEWREIGGGHVSDAVCVTTSPDLRLSDSELNTNRKSGPGVKL